jgi:hypothetical protein
VSARVREKEPERERERERISLRRNSSQDDAPVTAEYVVHGMRRRDLF